MIDMIDAVVDIADGLLKPKVEDALSNNEINVEDDAVGVSVVVPVILLVAVLLLLFVVEDVPLFEPVFEGDAPYVKEEVGEDEIEFDRLRVELGVFDEVTVPLVVALLVDVPLFDSVLVELGVFELLGVTDGLEPMVIEAVGDTETDDMSVGVVDAVLVGVTVADAVDELVGVTDGVFNELIVEDGDVVGESLALYDGEGVRLAVPP